MTRKPDQGLQQKQGLEETYERIYPKIARDFVTIDDLQALINELKVLVSVLGLPMPNLRVKNVNAMAQALLYKSTVEEGRDGTKLFKDLVEIDNDEEEVEE